MVEVIVGKKGALDANSRQVGGDHYKTGGPQHWDMFGPEYLIGCATKYVARWRKKNGREDLEKGLHYSEKLLEVVDRRGGGKAPTLPVDRSMIAIWGPNQGIDWPEITVIQDLMFFSHPDDIRRAVAGIKYLISTATPVVEEPVTAGQEIETELRRRERVLRMVHLDDGKTGPRPDADESRHASLYPWHVTLEQWNRLDGTRAALLRPFYRQMGMTGGWRLDVLVAEHGLPRELQGCYDVTDGCGWRIRISEVPLELRDEYPTLLSELSKFEHNERPKWEQDLYAWIDGEGKYRLRDVHAAWGEES